jgi:hypothetical protein
VANCIPRPNLRRLLVDLHVEGEPFRLAVPRHHLVHRRHHRLLCCHCPSRRIRSEGQIVGEGNTPRGSYHVGLNIEITEITIHPTNDELVRAYVSIVFDNCFMVGEIRVMQAPRDSSSHFLLRSSETGPIGILLFRPKLKRE